MADRLLSRAPAFRAYWLSRTVSYVGDGVSRIAIVLFVADRGPGTVGLVLLANTVPRFLGPVAGAVADRMEQRRLMAACDLGQAAVVGLIALTLPPTAGLLPLVCLSGLLATLFNPAGRSAVPSMVEPADLTRANAFLGTSFNLQLVVGPVLGAFAVAQGGFRLAFALDAVTFVVSALFLTRLPALHPQSGEPAGVFAETLAGLRYVARTPRPRALVLSLFLLVTFAGVDNVALVFLVRDSLHGTDTDYGAVLACYGIGMLAVSVVLAARVAKASPIRMLVTGNACTSAGIALTGVAPTLAVAGVTQAFAGIGNGLENIAIDTAVPQTVAKPMLGRVFGTLNTAAMIGSGIAYAVAGPLIAAFGPRAVFVGGGVCCASSILVLLPVLRGTTTD